MALSFRTSSYCTPDHVCVEVALGEQDVFIRSSYLDLNPGCPTLTVSPAAWQGFLTTVTGE